MVSSLIHLNNKYRYLVPGHYWLEARLTEIKKKQDKPVFNQENMPVAHKRFLSDSLQDNSNVSKNKSITRPSKPKKPLFNNMVEDTSKLEVSYNRRMSS